MTIVEDLPEETYLVSFEWFGEGAVYYIERLPAGYVYIDKKINRDEKEIRNN